MRDIQLFHSRPQLLRSRFDRREIRVRQDQYEFVAPDFDAEYRASVGNAAVHEKEAELMYVVDGSGTIVTGGTLVNPTRPNPTNLSGTGIKDGDAQSVAKGDFIIVPENTAHWISAINGSLVLMTLHIPRPVSTP
jgi:mannose-6-phosphate isomerase-like protein (cupin superfamily)